MKRKFRVGISENNQKRVMLNFKRFVVVLLVIVHMVTANSDATDELDDFAFDNVEPVQDFSYNNDDDVENIDRNADGLDDIEMSSFERRADVDVSDEDEPQAMNPFVVKEQLIRKSLQQATRQGIYTKKFAQLLPIIRALNKQQRLVLASLITAQSSAVQGKGLNLHQVESMFGERRSLILPILFDIANLVRSAADSVGNAKNSRSLTEIHNEEMPSAEFLRSDRFPTNVTVIPAGLQTLIEPTIADANMQDGRLHLDENLDEPSNIINVTESNNTLTKSENTPSLKGKSARSLSDRLPTIRKDDRSYHERKLNMTNFNGTHDQFAMESDGVPVQIAMPRSLFELNPNLTLEEYEELAFSELNDTDIIQYVRNETTGELLPMPEMLIARYRAKNPYRKLLTGTNSLDGLQPCERFGTICIHSEDYPMQAIMGSIRRHKHAMSALLAEYIDKDDIAATKPIDEVKRREDDELAPTGMCPSVIRYARPQKARSATGDWKYIVNTGQHTQTLRLEKCSKAEESCTYLTDNFRSRCVQVYNYHRLLSWDSTRGLHIDIFKVPTCCSCHIDGYKEKFPPINSYSGHDDYRFSASNVRSHHTPYSTILNQDDDDDDDDASIAYQYSNGFKRSPTKLGKFSDSSILSSNVKSRFDKNKHNKQHSYLTSQPLDSYLTPPTSSDFETGNFGRVGSSSYSGSSNGLSNRKRRRPVRTNNYDQSIASSDFLPDITNIPHHDHNTERTSSTFKRKSTTPISSVLSSNNRVASGVSIGNRESTGTVQLPSISTASTSSIDLGKRVNYNYHPIIDFFGDSMKSEKEIEDRVGFSETLTWRPVHNVMRRRQQR